MIKAMRKYKSYIPFNSVNNNDDQKLMSKEEYFAKIDKSLKEIEEGKIVEVSAEEMRRILSE
ncbi:MAG: hypothetical protein IJ728_00065 [Selenomonadaceae bacterium]|nr:hypothetical protein [Selenomonadaceae bacterium]